MARGNETNASRGWRHILKIFAIVIPYMLPLFWLWIKTDYPDSFGIHITAHGRTGLLESWWYSYLLLERPNFLDVITFSYMWAPVAGAIVWGAYHALRKRGFKLKIYDDAGPPDGGS